MVKPVESKSPHRPLRKDSEGRSVTLKATILRAGHVSTSVQIGANIVTLSNSTLRDVSGISDL
jgi:hypothetical protein